MLKDILNDLGTRGASVIFGLIAGSLVTWLITRWQRMKQKRRVFTGDARELVAINLHLVQRQTGSTDEGPLSLHIRSLGHGNVSQVIPNLYLANALMHRAWAVTSRNTLISMEGAEGSYLLETLTNFVCERVANAPFAHDLYVMAPCCEPTGLAQYQAITVILISLSDLALFESWPRVRELLVEHGNDGARILTLREMALRFKAEQETLGKLRREGKRTLFVETMYILDLGLDRQVAKLPLRRVPWGRFEKVLKDLDLE